MSANSVANLLLFVDITFLTLVVYRIDWATSPHSDVILEAGLRERKYTLIAYYCGMASICLAVLTVMSNLLFPIFGVAVSHRFVIFVGILLLVGATAILYRFGRLFSNKVMHDSSPMQSFIESSAPPCHDIVKTEVDVSTQENISIPEDVSAQESDKKSRDLELHNLVSSFESMGHDCELGLIQRHFGAEPLGMFRWGGTHIVYLIEMLEADFKDIDRLENNELTVINGEYYVANKKYRTGRHANAFVKDGPDPEKLLSKQVGITTFFVRHFREQMETGDKIFVFKDFDNAPPEAILALSQALRRNGPVNLLVVQAHGLDGVPVDFKQIGDHAWLGKVDRFGRAGGIYPSGWDISMSSWLELLARAKREIELNATPFTESVDAS